MLNKINKDVSILDKSIIVKDTSIKIIRGFLKKIFLKESKGFLFIGKSVSISHGKHICVGRNVKFESHSEIHGLSRKGLVFGDNVTIGSHVMIRPSSYYGVEYGEGMEIGENSSIGPYSFVGCSGKIKIGNNVMIGPRVSLFAENHNFSNTEETIKEQGVARKGIIIEDDCWIGSGVIILDGVRIGKGNIIAAGTLVSKDIPDKCITKDLRNKDIKLRL